MTLNLLELIAAGFIGAALLLGLIRLIIGPDAPDRVISADTMSVIITAALTFFAAYFNSALFLDVALVYGAISFIGAIAVARVIEGRIS
ncbi:MAG: cation:proton antiporter [Gammaproteobacteria bacterium]|nr:cation:proton antiporter [Gammaproteobacteria bacterium]